MARRPGRVVLVACLSLLCAYRGAFAAAAVASEATAGAARGVDVDRGLGGDGGVDGDFAAARLTAGGAELVYARGDFAASEQVATHDGERLKLLQLANGSRLALLVFGADDDDLLDCDVSSAAKADELRRYVASRRDDGGFTPVALSRQKVRALSRVDAWIAECRAFHARPPRAAEDGGGMPLDGRRLKRATLPLVYPGTKWCGRGNSAVSYDDLGERRIADSCCRVHDHCPRTITSMSTKYNYFNYRLYTVSHCDCDQVLYKCLKRAIRKHSDSVSQMIGHLFFNVVGMPCFVVEEQEMCAERSWWGTCVRTEKLAKARIANATRRF